MTTINPWINFNGNAEEAFTFYRSVLGGEITKTIRFKDIQNNDVPVSKDDTDKLMLIALTLTDTSVLYGNDVPAFMGTVSEEENRSKIQITAQTRDEAERICSGLSAGGNLEVPLDMSPWGTYFAMLRDRYGIEWIIECSGV